MHKDTIPAILPPNIIVLNILNAAINISFLFSSFPNKNIVAIIKTFGTQILVKIE